MAELREFSKIIILRDSPDTRWAFGAPLEGNWTNPPDLGPNTNNPYYNKLLNNPGQSYWRSGYPDIDSLLTPNAYTNSSIVNDETKFWFKAIKNDILQTIGIEESPSNGYAYQYDLPTTSSGTGIIYQDKFYIGSTSTVSYTSIAADEDGVTVSGTGMSTFAAGTKVILSTVGDTGLLTSTVYYIYNSTSTSFKLATSKSNALNGTAPTNFDGTAGAGEGKIISKDFSYNASTTYVSPAPELSVRDYIFWGEDANDLKIGGRIKKVYTSNDPEYADGARYQFEKDTIVAFPEYASGVYDGEPIPQNIYYYRNTWNGKGIKNDIGTGFYVLIGIEQDPSGQYIVYPWLNTTVPVGTPTDGIVDTSTSNKYAFTDYIRVRKISNPFKSDETNNQSFGGDELIPCTIHRTSNFYYDGTDRDTNNILIDLMGSTNNQTSLFPYWVAYYVNPYGGNSAKLDKNTTYVLEINERLPAAFPGNTNILYSWALGGAI